MDSFANVFSSVVIFRAAVRKAVCSIYLRGKLLFSLFPSAPQPTVCQPALYNLFLCLFSLLLSKLFLTVTFT